MLTTLLATVSRSFQMSVIRTRLTNCVIIFPLLQQLQHASETERPTPSAICCRTLSAFANWPRALNCDRWLNQFLGMMPLLFVRYFLIKHRVLIGKWHGTRIYR